MRYKNSKKYKIQVLKVSIKKSAFLLCTIYLVQSKAKNKIKTQISKKIILINITQKNPPFYFYKKFIQ